MTGNAETKPASLKRAFKSDLLKLYEAVGNDRYADEIANIAPYFGTISSKFKELRPGYCAVEIPNTRAVQNHLRTLHAIAMCNGAELAAGLTTDVSIPEGRRWIPVEMNVRYLGKAKTDVTVTCDAKDVDWTVLGDVVVPVTVSDTAGKEVCRASITMKISAENSPGIT
jgi:acyl-coenzyme A thioesterase PaaI-like protein